MWQLVDINFKCLLICFSFFSPLEIYVLKKVGHLPTVWVLLITRLWCSVTSTSVLDHLFIGYCT